MGAILVKRNILVFVLDQLSSRALDLYGGQFRMPTISTLATDGVTVDECYTTYPLCQPARASLWTGQYPHRNRVWSNGRECPITPIDSSFPALGEAFAAAGYETRHFGKKHDGGALRGFECSEEKERKIPDEDPAFPFNMDTYADAYTMDETLSYLRSRKDDRPLLMVVDLINPHNICGWIGKNKGAHEDMPYSGELPELPPNFRFDDIENRPLPVQYLCCSHVRQGQTSEWTEENFRHYLAAYRYYLSIADRQIGEVMEAYREAGLMDDSLIVFTSDHGDNITARRSVTKQVTLYEEVTSVPLIFSGPAVSAKGIVSHFKSIPQGAFEPQRVNPCQKSKSHKTLRFIQRKEMSYPVAEPLPDKTGIFPEPLRDIPVHPAAFLVQLIGKLPVIQRDVRFNPVLQKCVDQITVELYPLFVDSSGTFGKHP